MVLSPCFAASYMYSGRSNLIQDPEYDALYEQVLVSGSEEERKGLVTAADMEYRDMASDREALMRMLGLDVPFYVQYARWMEGIFLHGTLGNGVIMAQASLSFLGFGLPLDVPSWGGMLSREGRQYMEIAPRLALWPGLALTIVVYSLNMFGDAMRDLLDPRLRGGEG